MPGLRVSTTVCSFASALQIHFQTLKSRAASIANVAPFATSIDSSRLPLWRYWPRQKLLPLIRYETPYLAWVQEKVRTPTLDSYFAFTANLGTHTFFMVFLPFLFWCGHTSLGRGYVLRHERVALSACDR